MPDRRLDLDSRQRVVALEGRYRKVARHLTLGFAALTLGVVLALGLVWRASHETDRLARQTQDNRVTVLENVCEQRNREHLVIRQLLQRSLESAVRLKAEGTLTADQLARTVRSTDQAIASFPDEPDCRAYAQRQVRP